MLREAVRGMPSGAFGFVMATGILSTAFSTVGWQVPSIALVIVAAGALLVLGVLAVLRVVLFRSELLVDAQHPARAFGFFTIVAALNVVGIRLYALGFPGIAIALAVISIPVWLLCTYGIPGGMMLRSQGNPVAEGIDGSWFLWVVGTQSLATVSAVLDGSSPGAALAAIAIALWGIGVTLYLMLATLVTLRLLTVPNRPGSFTPSYWIYMGATAITVLAGSRILLLDPDLPAMRAVAPLVSGATYVLWAFGVWWVPLLVIFGIWRHLVNHERLRYETGLWSIVFPLGMYSVASMHFGAVAGLAFMVSIGRVATVIAAVAWLSATVAAISAAVRYLRSRRREPPVVAGR